MQSDHFPLHTPFKPSPSLVTWFIGDFLLLIMFLAIVILLPMYLSSAVDTGIFLGIIGGLVVLVILFAIWTKLYYESMWYELHEDEMRWKRGVIFRRTGIVPYNRITNLDIRQGPVMRRLDISTISIQTAGYSGQAQAAEIRIEAIVHAEELRELVRSMVRTSVGGDGTGTGGRAPLMKTSEIQMLDELKAIRALLEKKI
ncbi:MAG TPA: PH domain-containing protein [Methanoregulaceae archaeon]|nr:PH domain-containing protein [Methanoregulaceae archaeon]HPM62555.1 PH domain-containing protein [Methanoregulaceae archaeon]